MADRLHFDMDRALDGFLRIFWMNGYRATTTRDLAKSAAISESSLFNSFTSKRAVYIKTLRRYREKSRFMLENMENAESALDGIRNYWQALGKIVADPKLTRGCMITNASIEQADELEILAFLQEVHRAYDRDFQKTLDRARAQGELKPDTDTKALAQYLAHSAQGLRVLAKINPGKKKVKNIVELTLSTLDQFRTDSKQSQ